MNIFYLLKKFIKFKTKNQIKKKKKKFNNKKKKKKN